MAHILHCRNDSTIAFLLFPDIISLIVYCSPSIGQGVKDYVATYSLRHLHVFCLPVLVFHALFFLVQSIGIKSFGLAACLGLPDSDNVPKSKIISFARAIVYTVVQAIRLGFNFRHCDNLTMVSVDYQNQR